MASSPASSADGQKRLGELLVEMGFIDEDQLNTALKRQRHWGKRLGWVLVQSGFLSEARLVRGLSRQLNIDTCDPVTAPVHERVRSLVPHELALRLRVVPIAIKRGASGDVLFVATADPLNEGAETEVSSRAGMSIEWLLAGESEIDRALSRHYDPRSGTLGIDPNMMSEAEPTRTMVGTMDSSPPDDAPAEDFAEDAKFDLPTAAGGVQLPDATESMVDDSVIFDAGGESDDSDERDDTDEPDGAGSDVSQVATEPPDPIESDTDQASGGAADDDPKAPVGESELPQDVDDAASMQLTETIDPPPNTAVADSQRDTGATFDELDALPASVREHAASFADAAEPSDDPDESPASDTTRDQPADGVLVDQASVDAAQVSAEPLDAVTGDASKVSAEAEAASDGLADAAADVGDAALATATADSAAHVGDAGDVASDPNETVDPLVASPDAEAVDGPSDATENGHAVGAADAPSAATEDGQAAAAATVDNAGDAPSGAGPEADQHDDDDVVGDTLDRGDASDSEADDDVVGDTLDGGDAWDEDVVGDTLDSGDASDDDVVGDTREGGDALDPAGGAADDAAAASGRDASSEPGVPHATPVINVTRLSSPVAVLDSIDPLPSGVDEEEFVSQEVTLSDIENRPSLAQQVKEAGEALAAAMAADREPSLPPEAHADKSPVEGGEVPPAQSWGDLVPSSPGRPSPLTPNLTADAPAGLQPPGEFVVRPREDSLQFSILEQPPVSELPDPVASLSNIDRPLPDSAVVDDAADTEVADASDAVAGSDVEAADDSEAVDDSEAADDVGDSGPADDVGDSDAVDDAEGEDEVEVGEDQTAVSESDAPSDAEVGVESAAVESDLPGESRPTLAPAGSSVPAPDSLPVDIVEVPPSDSKALARSAREALQQVADGETIDAPTRAWLDRVLAAIFLQQGLLDQGRLERAIELVGAPDED